MVNAYVKDVILFNADPHGCCPIANNEENKEFEGELLPNWKGNEEISWCHFATCGMSAGDNNMIWSNPGYKVKGILASGSLYMWIPASIVSTVPAIIKLEKKKISKWARLGTKI